MATTSSAKELVNSANTSSTDTYPRIIILVGPSGTVKRIWRHEQVQLGRTAIEVTSTEFPAAEWLNAVDQSTSLNELALRHLADLTGRDATELCANWQSRTAIERERLISLLPQNEIADCIRQLSNHQSVAQYCEGTRLVDHSLIAQVIQWTESANQPSALFQAESLDDLLALASSLSRWAERVPQLSLAIAVSDQLWQHYLAAASPSRSKSMLIEGMQNIALATPNEIIAALEDEAISESLKTAAPLGIDYLLLGAAATLRASTVHKPDSVDADDRARSAAERMLFELLERWPETNGLFELNGKLDFRFGSRLAEIDLLCREFKIAIELDGYFHFQSPSNYRRDRDKDWELQRRGYVVLRFLAEDVLPCVADIRDRIFSAIQFQRSPRV